MMNKLRLLSIVALLSTGSTALADRVTVQMTSYNSEVSQTDSTPFITSTGMRVRYGIVAASPNLIRKYGYGAKVRVVKYIGGRGCGRSVPIGSVFTIQDSTAASKYNTVDFWSPSKTNSLKFGRCTVIVDITKG